MRSTVKIFQRIRRFASCEKGGALAELAIMVPFLVIMLAGVSEFGRYFQQYTTLAKSCRAAARYLSNRPITPQELANAQNIATCGKLVCVGGTDDLVYGLSTGGNKICVESAGSPKITSVTVRIPRDGSCNPISGSAGASPFVFRPVFDLGALLHTSLTLAVPVAPRVTMYYMVTD